METTKPGVMEFAGDGAVVVYSWAVAHHLTVRVTELAELYVGLGLSLPVATMFVVRACLGPWPYLAAVVVTLVVLVKARVAATQGRRLGVSLGLMLMVAAWQWLTFEAAIRPQLHVISTIR